ncbi:MAG: DUF4249 domain-containing protein [Bacteroidia bacterium]
MKNLIFLIPVLLFFSCEKVIDVDLNEANENIVIEAKFNAETKTADVLISKTTGYFNPEEIQFVDDAVVMISNQNGDIQKIELSENGNYSTTVNFVLTDSLTIEIDHDLGFFTSTSEIIEPSELQNIEFIKATGPLAQANGDYIIRVDITDKEDEENYYMFETYKNGQKLGSLRGYDVIDDQTANNGAIGYFFIGNAHNIGDTVDLRLMAINKDAYKYYGDLAQQTSEGMGGASASPANPVNNWSNNALGYFMVFAPTDHSIVIKE